MNTYDFTLILNNVFELSEDLANRLFEAGCDDATPSSSNGIVAIDFSREAADLESAIRSAVAQVAATGCQVKRVQIDAEAMALKS